MKGGGGEMDRGKEEEKGKGIGGLRGMTIPKGIV